jgi:sulfite oxidase
LTDDFLTPPSEMYVRNHNLVPSFDEDFELEFQLEIISFGEAQKQFSLEEIKKMKKHQVTTSIACAGNRRSHTRKVYSSVKGINWGVGAIGNNTYEGVLLTDLLAASGISQDDVKLMKGKHLVATGLDQDFQGEPFSASIPMERVMDPSNEVLVAWNMNGQPLT